MSPVSELTPAQAAALETYATRLGLTTSALILLAAQALAAHSQQHSTLTLPLRIGLPSPACILCPNSTPAIPPEADNILKARFI